MNLHWTNRLIKRTVKSDEEADALRFSGLTAFIAALELILSAGFTAAQLQWLIGVPFCRFGDNERFKVMLLALSLERGTGQVEDWQQRLVRAEFWSRLHGQSTLFTPDPLPDWQVICRDLGISAEADRVTGTAVTPVHKPRYFYPHLHLLQPV